MSIEGGRGNGEFSPKYGWPHVESRLLFKKIQEYIPCFLHQFRLNFLRMFKFKLYTDCMNVKAAYRKEFLLQSYFKNYSRNLCKWTAQSKNKLPLIYTRPMTKPEMHKTSSPHILFATTTLHSKSFSPYLLLLYIAHVAFMFIQAAEFGETFVTVDTCMVWFPCGL